MLKIIRILVNAIALASSAVGLSACGQQGPLYLPAEPAAAKHDSKSPASNTPSASPTATPQ
jgi:predicted small lipoprotein YifL